MQSVGSGHRVAVAGIFSLLPLLSLGGCVPIGPVSVGGSYVGGTAKSDPAASGKCGVYLQAIRDLRPDKDDEGNVAGRPVHATNLVGWLSSGLGSLQADGYRVDATALTDDRLVVRVELLKAYMQSVYMSISSNLVVRVSYMRSDGMLLGEQVYRGNDISANWASGDGEIAKDFKLATTDLLKQVEPDLRNYCLQTNHASALSH